MEESYWTITKRVVTGRGDMGVSWWIAQVFVFTLGGVGLLIAGAWWGLALFPFALWALICARREARRQRP